MRSILISMGCLILLAALTGCHSARPVVGLAGPAQAIAYTPIQPPPGFIFQETSAPLSFAYNKTPVSPGKVGEASTRFFSLWPLLGPWASVGMDNASLEEAARNAGITEVNYADYKMFNVLGVFSEFTVVVYGN